MILLFLSGQTQSKKRRRSEIESETGNDNVQGNKEDGMDDSKTPAAAVSGEESPKSKLQ